MHSLQLRRGRPLGLECAAARACGRALLRGAVDPVGEVAGDRPAPSDRRQLGLLGSARLRIAEPPT